MRSPLSNSYPAIALFGKIRTENTREVHSFRSDRSNENYQNYMTEKDSIFKTDGTDEVYCAIKSKINPRCQEAKMFVEELWGKAHAFIDSDASKKLPNEFHQRFWEIYLAAALLEADLNLQHSSGRDGPDICIKANNGSKIWVEAITASSGKGDDAVQRGEPGVIRDVPDDPIKIRLLNSFDKKWKQYERYRKKNWISSEEPYIIAINAAKVPSATCELEIPRIVRSLLPFGFQVLHLDKEKLEVTNTSYEYQGKVIKTNGAEIET